MRLSPEAFDAADVADVAESAKITRQVQKRTCLLTIFGVYYPMGNFIRLSRSGSPALTRNVRRVTKRRRVESWELERAPVYTHASSYTDTGLAMGAAIVVILMFAAGCAFPLLITLGGSPSYPADPAERARERIHVPAARSR